MAELLWVADQPSWMAGGVSFSACRVPLLPVRWPNGRDSRSVLMIFSDGPFYRFTLAPGLNLRYPPLYDDALDFIPGQGVNQRTVHKSLHGQIGWDNSAGWER